MAAVSRASETPEEAGPTARVRVLIVDDSPSSRGFVANVLTELANVETIEVDSGAQALRALAQGDISIVVCDYDMPDMSGLQVLRVVRQKHSSVELPVLMITAYDEPQIKVQSLRAGANDYIGKQAEPEEFLARVGTQIELLQAHRRLNDSRLRRAEHQKFEAIGHLAEGLAHELNTPAQYIQDNLAFLTESFEALGVVVAELRQLPSAAERSLVETVLERIEYNYLIREIPRCLVESRQGIEQVARVIAVMREFARPGLPERNSHSLNEIIRGALAVTRGQWHQVAELELELCESLPNVQCFGVAIKQVVLYAVLNAVKAMGRPGNNGRPKGKLRIGSRVESPGWVLIEIEDNGRGIADTTLQRVLDPVLGSRPTEDSGQALAHARAVIVDEHHGRLDIRSSPDGTSLTIRLPIEARFVAEPDMESDDGSTWG
jgi:signal transduction histidine kinase